MLAHSASVVHLLCYHLWNGDKRDTFIVIMKIKWNNNKTPIKYLAQFLLHNKPATDTSFYSFCCQYCQVFASIIYPSITSKCLAEVNSSSGSVNQVDVEQNAEM
jgi:hypothetical protein